MERDIVTDEDLERLFRLARKHLGLKPPSESVNLLPFRKRLIRAADSPSPAAIAGLLDRLERTQDLELLQDMVEGLSVGETHFYRHPVQINKLESIVFPDIIRRKAGDVQEIVVWCAGCSTGEEPYTLSILLKEKLKEMSGWSYTVVGTDINQDAINQARVASYTSWSFRSVPDWFISRGFDTRGDKYVLRPKFRETVLFETYNLAADRGAPRALLGKTPDLILCRNVLIYMTSFQIPRIFQNFYQVLGKVGWLLVGPSESPMASQMSPFVAGDRAGLGLFRIPTPDEVPISRRLTNPRMRLDEIFPPSSSVPTPEPPVPRIPLRPKVDTGAGLLSPGANNGIPPESAVDSHGADGEGAATPGGSEALLKEAWRLADLGLSGQALQTVVKVLQQEELHAEAYLLRGLLEREMGKSNLSKESLKKAIFLDWHLAAAHFHLANLLVRNGQVAVARKHLSALRSILIGRSGDELVDHTGGMSVNQILKSVDSVMERNS